MSKLKNCPDCKNEVSKSAKKCPHCGKKLKGSIFMKIIIIFILLIVISAVLSPSKEENNNKLREEITFILNSNPSTLAPTGELAEIFNFTGEGTEIQRKNKEEEIKGKIVQWKLPVANVKKRNNFYRVQTSGEGAFGGIKKVGTFIDLYPQSENEIKYIENLTKKNEITIRGKISGISVRNIEISPAILIKKE